MADFILLMHADGGPETDADWEAYFEVLQASGQFRGGSAIGAGGAFRRGDAGPAGSTTLTGYIRVEADTLEAAQVFLIGNPVFEAGGTVEIRELPRTD